MCSAPLTIPRMVSGRSAYERQRDGETDEMKWEQLTLSTNVTVEKKIHMINTEDNIPNWFYLV